MPAAQILRDTGTGLADVVHAERDHTKRITAVVHALAKPPHAADKIATALIKQELTLR